MLWKYVTGACFMIVFALTGCSSQEKVDSSTNKEQMEIQVPKTLSEGDKTFMKALEQSLDTVQQKITEFEMDMQDMQGYDEFHDAKEMMTEAKQDVLYYWNQMHNEYKPEHPDLQKIKADYERLLSQYREGLTIELEGMTTGNPEKMKLGYQMTQGVMEEIQKFKEQVDKLFSKLIG